MARPNYGVLKLDLATARTLEAVVPVGTEWDGVRVVSVPVGAGVEMALGSNAQLIPVTAGDEVSLTDDCGHPFHANEGIFIANPVGAGLLVLVVSYGVTP